MSTSGTQELVASCPEWSSGYTDDEQQMSERITLDGGKAYYMEVSECETIASLPAAHSLVVGKLILTP